MGLDKGKHGLRRVEMLSFGKYAHAPLPALPTVKQKEKKKLSKLNSYSVFNWFFF